MITIGRNQYDLTAKYKGSFARTLLKDMLREQGVTLAELSDRHNRENLDVSTTPQNISNKLTRDTVKLKEFILFSGLLGYDVEFVNKSSQQKHYDKVLCFESKSHDVECECFNDLLSSGLKIICGKNIPTIIIAGKNANIVADTIDTISCSGIADEIVTVKNIAKQYGCEVEFSQIKCNV